ncbi:helix-turn-helix domain-containing protein [Streptomyces exfoliatus]|uniref:helix-turn-helix domain-containing protein n=1 Tax=Streptomyces exfoliatus TaxID=1905 RepID=UPI00379C264F
MTGTMPGSTDIPGRTCPRTEVRGHTGRRSNDQSVRPPSEHRNGKQPPPMRSQRVSVNTVRKCRGRCAALGRDGLKDATRLGRPKVYGPQLALAIVAAATSAPPHREATWSHRTIAAQVASTVFVTISAPQVGRPRADCRRRPGPPGPLARRLPRPVRGWCSVPSGHALRSTRGPRSTNRRITNAVTYACSLLTFGVPSASAIRSAAAPPEIDRDGTAALSTLRRGSATFPPAWVSPSATTSVRGSLCGAGFPAHVVRVRRSPSGGTAYPVNVPAAGWPFHQAGRERSAANIYFQII